jgi:hypothetical protein
MNKYTVLLASSHNDGKPLGGEVTGLGRFQGTDTAPTQLNNLFSTIFGFLTIIAGLSFLIYFLIGGLTWITAGGDSKKVDTAKAMMTNGAIGMIIIVATYGVVWIVGEVLGINILDPGATLDTLFNAGGTSSNGGGGGGGNPYPTIEAI